VGSRRGAAGSLKLGGGGDPYVKES
jgi:hypothetical protein